MCIRDSSNANNWGRSPGEQHAEIFEEVIMECPQQQIISYTALEEDEYYVILHNSLSEQVVTYNVALSFARFEYNPLNISIFCFAPSGGQCTVGIPYGSGSQLALIVTTIPENVDWGENVDVKTSCNRRDWVFALIVLLPLSVLTFLAMQIIICLCIWLDCYSTCV